ncbi:MAG: DUF1761 domain-containing protein [Mobilitalea sp.]
MNTIQAFLQINYIAVFFALIVHMLIGTIWYHPIVFGGIWEKIAGQKIRINTKLVPINIVAHILSHIALAAILILSKDSTLLDAFFIGLLVSIGFISTVLACEYSWGRFSFKQFIIKIGDEVLSYSIAGIVLYLWK